MSCDVPAWMSVLSVIEQLSVTQPPPMPTQDAEYSAWPDVCCLAVGTTQPPETCVNNVPVGMPGYSLPMLWPDQLLDWLVLRSPAVCTEGTWTVPSWAPAAAAAPGTAISGARAAAAATPTICRVLDLIWLCLPIPAPHPGAPFAQMLRLVASRRQLPTAPRVGGRRLRHQRS